MVTCKRLFIQGPRGMPQRTSTIPAYLRQVDNALFAMAGVRYSAMQEDLERLPVPGGIRLDRAIGDYTDPQRFAISVSEALGFKPTSDDPDAGKLNTRLVALATFVAENPEWKQGERAAYREVGDGVARIAPWRSPGGAWGFATDFAPSASLELAEGARFHGVVPADAVFETGGAALDIVDALEKLEPVIEHAASGPGMGR